MHGAPHREPAGARGLSFGWLLAVIVLVGALAGLVLLGTVHLVAAAAP